MCGICGKFNYDALHPVDANLIDNMLATIGHRGPDGAGKYQNGAIALGHRRLSIIDLSTGEQPMSNEDGTIWVVFNGEIYNFQALRKDLVARGHKFRSDSDTEVIVHLYEDLGRDCVEKLHGMFAFAVWDSRCNRLFLARDRVGIKPLYYANTGKSLVFGSEIKSILVDADISRQIRPSAIDRFLTYYYIPGSETMFQNIYKLEPGHTLTIDRQGVHKHQYWDLNFDANANRDLSYTEAVEKLQELLSIAVREHMVSDVPVGVLLSGGVDSSGVLSYAASHSSRQLHTFTMGFDGTTVADERPYAALVAQRFGTVHRDISMSAGQFRNFLPYYVWHMEEPVCEPPAVALYFVSQLARDNSVKVLLSGEGGDEAFGGYQEYRNLQTLESLKSHLGPFGGLLKHVFMGLAQAGWKRGTHYAGLASMPLADYYFSRTASPQTPFNQLKPRLYTRQFANGLASRSSNQPTYALWKDLRSQPSLNGMLYIDTKSWLPDDLLIKADKLSMAASVELRVPLLDHRILEFAARLPTSYKVRGWQLKRLLKDALKTSVPEVILNRPKTGFPVPYKRWLQNELRDYLYDTILAPNAYCSNYFSRPVCRELLQSLDRHGECAKECFSLLILELWHQQFISETPYAPKSIHGSEPAIPASTAA